MNHLCSLPADSANGVIYYVRVELVDSSSSFPWRTNKCQCYPSAQAGHDNDSNHTLTEARRDANLVFGQYEPEKAEFASGRYYGSDLRCDVTADGN